MKIATWNVNSVNARLETVLAWFREAQPDVACLQEIKCIDEKFPAEAFESLGYNVAVHGQKSYNGVALVSKTPLEDVRKGLPGDDGDDHARYIEAVVSGPSPVRVASIYLPNGNPQPGPKFDYKLDWFDRLLDHAAGLIEQDVPVILAGDYNVVPTDFDIYSVKSFVKNALLQPAPRAGFAKLVEMGWTDALRELHPDDTIFTFWNYLRNRWPRDAGLRLDHLLLSPAIALRLKAAGVDREVRGEPNASDHAPAWIRLAAAARPVRKPRRR